MDYISGLSIEIQICQAWIDSGDPWEGTSCVESAQLQQRKKRARDEMQIAQESLRILRLKNTE
jgi:hypothetical protein